MGNNYYNEISDALTDAFDLFLQTDSAQNDPTIAQMIRFLKKSTDETFRHNYSQAKELTK